MNLLDAAIEKYIRLVMAYPYQCWVVILASILVWLIIRLISYEFNLRVGTKPTYTQTEQLLPSLTEAESGTWSLNETKIKTTEPLA